MSFLISKTFFGICFAFKISLFYTKMDIHPIVVRTKNFSFSTTVSKKNVPNLLIATGIGLVAFGLLMSSQTSRYVSSH
jgi:hypothetical protein